MHPYIAGLKYLDYFYRSVAVRAKMISRSDILTPLFNYNPKERSCLKRRSYEIVIEHVVNFLVVLLKLVHNTKIQTSRSGKYVIIEWFN